MQSVFDECLQRFGKDVRARRLCFTEQLPACEKAIDLLR
jgi:hypothetical protein